VECLALAESLALKDRKVFQEFLEYRESVEPPVLRDHKEFQESQE
jgi:hypothetical protein